MRDHIRTLIDQATKPAGPLDGEREPALRLASEAIRLARLAASTHMILAARKLAETHAPVAGMQAGGGAADHVRGHAE